MTERPAERRSPAIVIAIVMLFLLPFGYVVSIGPVNWLITKGYLDSDGPSRFYYPLIYLAEHNDAAKHVFVWYLSMFGNV